MKPRARLALALALLHLMHADAIIRRRMVTKRSPPGTQTGT